MGVSITIRLTPYSEVYLAGQNIVGEVDINTDSPLKFKSK